jgi:predicted HAD superfamily Cof-like phosphohydrolase
MLELDYVKAFHIKYQIPIVDNPSTVPLERIQLRLTLLNEEVKELLEADNIGNIEEIAKEACDVLYVLLGTALELGYHQGFEDKVFFNGLINNVDKAYCLTHLHIMSEAFKTDWSKDNLKRLLVCLSVYLQYAGLKNIFPAIIAEVHRSNMSKGTNGKPIIRADGKIMKGTDFSLADLSFITNKELCVLS